MQHMPAALPRVLALLLFCLHSTVAAEQVRTATAAVPIPPAFPLAYAGKLFVAGAPPTVYLRNGGAEMQAATTGQVVAGAFRIDAIETYAMRVTHLPTGVQQTLDYGNMMRVAPAALAAVPAVPRASLDPLPPPPPVTEVPPGVLVPFIGR